MFRISYRKIAVGFAAAVACLSLTPAAPAEAVTYHWFSWSSTKPKSECIKVTNAKLERISRARGSVVEKRKMCAHSVTTDGYDVYSSNFKYWLR